MNKNGGAITTKMKTNVMNKKKESCCNKEK